MKLHSRKVTPKRADYSSPYFWVSVRRHFLKLRSELTRGHNINWNILRSIMYKLNMENSQLPYIRKFLIGVLKLLIKYKCQNVNIIARVVQLTFYIGVPNNSDEMILRGRIYAKSQTLSLPAQHEIRYLFSLSYGRENRDDLFRPILTNIVNYACNFEFLKILLKFGVIVFPNYTWREITYLNIVFLIIGRNPELIRNIEFIAMMDQAVHELPQCLLVMNLIKDENINENHIAVKNILQCLKLLFQDVSFPAIPIQDVTELLLRILPEREVLEILDEYEVHFPECKAPYAPRELKHLCRYKIRQCLRKARTIHYAIPSLLLPRQLKKYLLLQDNDYYGDDPFKIDSERFPEISPTSFHYPESTLSFFDSL